MFGYFLKKIKNIRKSKVEFHLFSRRPSSTFLFDPSYHLGLQDLLPAMLAVRPLQS